MNVLIYDSIFSNHLLEYFEYIIDYLDHKNKYHKIYIILHPSFFYFYNKSVKYVNWKEYEAKNIFFTSIPKEIDNALISKKSILGKSYIEERFISKFCSDNNVQHVILLNLDHFQIALGLRSFFLWRKRLTFSGILFSSYYYLPAFTKRRFKKKIQLFAMLINGEIRKVYVLNDNRIVNDFNANFWRAIFSYLPDPVSVRKPINNTSFRTANGISKDDFLLLSLGRISHRKNIHNIIRALDQLPSDHLGKIKFVVCGTFDDDAYRSELLNCITSRIKNNILFVDSFLSIDEFESIIEESDCVCTVYVDFYGSSGILGNAAKSRKLVLASEFGTIAGVVQKYKLGVTVNPLSPLSICDGLSKILRDGPELIRGSEFAEFRAAHHPDLFTGTLFSLVE